jgi:2-phosphoglycolate phosphatase
MIDTVLFDLDGTLLDTAPDLAYTLNRMREEHALEPLPFEQIRPVVSHGSIGLLRLGFGLEPDHPDFAALRDQLLAIYARHLADETRLFSGMPQLLDALETRGVAWGVVTNKPSSLTEPLLEQLGLAQRTCCIVSGDSTERRKPDPEPLQLACRLAGRACATCVYVGDAERDIQAGRRAGMKTLVAGFGYLGAEDQPEQWGADAIVSQPGAILDWLVESNRS